MAMKSWYNVWRCALAAVLLIGSAAYGQGYPKKPVRIIAPFAAGGGTDVIARMVAERFSTVFGAPFYVENIAGANGIVGTTAAAKSSPDGYTLVLGSTGPNAVNGALYPKLAYDPGRDFVPVSTVATIPNVLVVNSSVPAKTVAELVQLARSTSNGLSYGSTGIGSPAHLAAELFSSAENIKMVHIAYKGVAAALPDLLSGNIQLMFPDILSALPHIRSGRLRALGITTAKRSDLVPDIPTLAEAGVPTFSMGLWYALFSPTGTPPEIVQRLNAEMTKMLNDPEVRKKIAAQGAEALPSSVEESNAFIMKEIARWSVSVKKLGITLD
jgi:tripartite-type tricarboxylate transporter receptor subunit TctC